MELILQHLLHLDKEVMLLSDIFVTLVFIIIFIHVESCLRPNENELPRFSLFLVLCPLRYQVAILRNDARLLLIVLILLILLHLAESVTDNRNEQVKHHYHHEEGAEDYEEVRYEGELRFCYESVTTLNHPIGSVDSVYKTCKTVPEEGGELLVSGLIRVLL